MVKIPEDDPEMSTRPQLKFHVAKRGRHYNMISIILINWYKKREDQPRKVTVCQ